MAKLSVSSPPMRSDLSRLNNVPFSVWSGGAVAPELLAHALVQPRGERLGETVGQRFHHDRRIIVIGALEAGGDLVLADAGGDGEAADVVGKSARARRDEIGQCR